MDSHITGPMSSGYGALASVRGKVIDFDTPAGDYELGIIQASEDKPVMVETFLTDEFSFDATAGPTPAFNLAIILQKVSSPGTTIPLTYATAIAAGYDGPAPLPVRAVLTENWRAFIRFSPGTDGTTGRSLAALRVSGLGQLPIEV